MLLLILYLSYFQVQQLFPHFSLPIIIDDLRVTRSVELTIENILDGRLNSTVFHESEAITPSPNNSLAVLQSNTEASSSSTSHNWDELTTENENVEM